MDPRSAPTDGSVGESVAAPRQRWRLVVSRSADAPRLAGRELSDAWEAAIEATGLPLHRPAGRSRGRVAFGAPLPLGIVAERELIDVFLNESIPIWRIREAFAGAMPDGWSLVDAFDVWVGGPPLAGRVVAADYRVELAGGDDADALGAAVRQLLAASTLPRVRPKGGASVAYDLRPLLADLAVVDRGPPMVLRVRGRIHPELGTGRPDEVLAALGERLGRELEVREVVRERLILAGEPTDLASN